MTPEQRARLDAWMDGRETDSYWLESRRECVKAALARIDDLAAENAILRVHADDLDQKLTKYELQDARRYNALAKERDALAARLGAHERLLPTCAQHRPDGHGARSGCLLCEIEAQSGALSRVSYLCGPPNEMEVGPYDVHGNAAEVVEEAKALAARVAVLEDSRRLMADVAEDRLARADRAEALVEQFRLLQEDARG